VKMTLYEGLARVYLGVKARHRDSRDSRDSSRPNISTVGSSSRVSSTSNNNNSNINSNKNSSSSSRVSSTDSTNNTTTTNNNNNNNNADALSSLEAGLVGLLSGVLTAILTCPIDCVNTRIKSGERALQNLSVTAAHFEIIKKDGVTALFRGLVPRSAILGLGSTVFWFLQASVMAQLQRVD
jgi:hypothetical protein